MDFVAELDGVRVTAGAKARGADIVTLAKYQELLSCPFDSHKDPVVGGPCITIL